MATRGTDQGTFEKVVELLESWEPTFQSYTVAEERMQLFLDRAMNPDPIESPQTAQIKTPPSETSCDLVINDEIGINIYRSFTESEFTAFRRLLSTCNQRYVIMYAYDLPVSDSSMDQWRWTRTRYSGGRGDIEDIRFVHYRSGGEEPSQLESLLDNTEVILFGVLTMVVGVALLVGGVSGGQSIVGGPVMTALTSVVLIGLLVLLWGISE